MSRRRKQPSLRSQLRAIQQGGELEVPTEYARFRIVCGCQTPPVPIRIFLVMRRVGDEGRRGESHTEALERLGHILIAKMRALPDGGYESRQIETVGEGSGKRQKPVEWRCGRCRVTVRPTLDQANEWAAKLLDAGKDELDIRQVAGRRPPSSS